MPFLQDIHFKTIEQYLNKPSFRKSDIKVIKTNLDELSLTYEEPYANWFMDYYYDLLLEDNEVTQTSYLMQLKNEVARIRQGEPYLKDSIFQSLLNMTNDEIYSWTSTTFLNELSTFYEKYEEPFSTWISFSEGGYYDNVDYQMDLLLCGSMSMAQENELIYRFNPAVFQSCTLTMRYSAFFRYIKEHNPRSWTSFISTIKGIDPKTVLPDKPGALVNKGIITPNQISER